MKIYRTFSEAAIAVMPPECIMPLKDGRFIVYRKEEVRFSTIATIMPGETGYQTDYGEWVFTKISNPCMMISLKPKQEPKSDVRALDID